VTDWATFAAAVSTGVVGLAGIAATAVVSTQERRHRDSERLYGSCVALVRNIDNTIVTGGEALIWSRLSPDSQARVRDQALTLNLEASAAISSLRLQLPLDSPIDRAALQLVEARNAYALKLAPDVDYPTLNPLEVVLLAARERFIAEFQRVVPPPMRWRRRKSRGPQSEPNGSLGA
jgi:hypothetical protein